MRETVMTDLHNYTHTIREKIVEDRISLKSDAEIITLSQARIELKLDKLRPYHRLHFAVHCVLTDL